VTYSSDFAILELTAAVSQTPIALPRNTDTGLWQPGVRVVGAGWGCQIPNAYPDYACEGAGGSPLTFTTFATTDGSACRTAFGPNSFDADTGLCLQDEVTTDQTCNGDSGGPYIVSGSDNRWYLVALVSYGPKGCTPGLPVVGARIAHILDGTAAVRADIGWITCVGAQLCSYPG
jgi:secreted trypsin-like serine protease